MEAKPLVRSRTSEW